MSIDWATVFTGLKVFLDPLAVASWPIAFVTSVLILRPQISKLFDRLRNVRGLGAEADFDLRPQVPQIAENPLGREIDDSNSGLTRMPTDPAISSIPPQSDIYQPVEQNLANLLENTFPSDLDGKYQWALRSYARAEVERYHEANFRIIFGSQLQAINLVNQVPNMDVERLHLLFNETRDESESSKSVLDSIGFSNWLEFLTSIKYLEKNLDGKLRVTLLGRDFLTWIVGRGVNQDRIA